MGWTRSVALLVIGAVTACGPAVPARAGRVGSTIALLADGRVAVLNPDQGSLSFLDPVTLGAIATVAVGGRPAALLQLASGAIWVANHHDGTISPIDPVAMAPVAAVPVCPMPAALAESPDQSWVAVACEGSGEVLRLDPTTLASTVVASGLRRPRSLAIVGGSVVVGEFTGGDVVEIDAAGKVSSLSLTPGTAPYRPALTQMTANLPAAVVPAFGHLFVAHELVNHTGTATDEQVAPDYGTVLDGNPKINAALTRLILNGEAIQRPDDTPATYSRFDQLSHVFSGPAAAVAFGSQFMLVAHVSTADVAVIDTLATDPNQRLVATYEVGAGPSGVAVDAQGQTAWVDNAVDGSVSRLDLTLARSASAPDHPAALTLVRGLPSPFSDAARAGRQLFYDATNIHVTPSRSVACATCHPGGTDDGLVWFIHTPAIPLKRRRTPNLANSTTPTAPYHWDGEFATMTDLVNTTVTDLMGGDDLLVDAASVQAFVDEVVVPPVGPAKDPAAVQRGQAIFNSSAAGCSGCHSGPSMTDGLEHAVLEPMSLSSDDVFTTANTPALHGLFYRAPFFHDGRSSTLLDLLTRPDASTHGDTSGLSPSQLSDLQAYLSSL
jgi:DNA-binding beta-propeller fold protein YncE